MTGDIVSAIKAKLQLMRNVTTIIPTNVTAAVHSGIAASRAR